MAKIYIQLESKNFALYGDRIEIESDIIPRVGEIIDAAQYLEFRQDEVSRFMVSSLIYNLTKNGFVPYICAHQSHKGFRHKELQERGWLVPEKVEDLKYDEDDLRP